MKKFIIFLLIVSVLVLYQLRRWAADAGPLESPVNVLIPRGANSGIVAEKLYEAGVIDKPWLLKIASRLVRLDKSLKAGEYQFNPGVSMVEVMQKIAKGDILYRKLTLPEGLMTSQILDIIKNEPMLDGTITIQVKEGELLPETYSFVRGDTRDSVVSRAKKAMETLKAKVWAARGDRVPLKSPEEMIVLASIIEKETGIAEERGLVASVFVNRLTKGMKLQTDPTVIYALTKGKNELERPLTRKDLEIDNPYNTYKYYGLPPAPICNPGKDAIEAAVNPEYSDYLYFVASGNGGHNFAKSLDEHNSNVVAWKKKNKKN